MPYRNNFEECNFELIRYKEFRKVSVRPAFISKHGGQAALRSNIMNSCKDEWGYSQPSHIPEILVGNSVLPPIFHSLIGHQMRHLKLIPGLWRRDDSCHPRWSQWSTRQRILHRSWNLPQNRRGRDSAGARPSKVLYAAAKRPAKRQPVLGLAREELFICKALFFHTALRTTQPCQDRSFCIKAHLIGSPVDYQQFFRESSFNNIQQHTRALSNVFIHLRDFFLTFQALQNGCVNSVQASSTETKPAEGCWVAEKNDMLNLAQKLWMANFLVLLVSLL